ncbi:uncharacterized protein LOC108092567 [Drosophila ficusphila]|uniref:uncharacterized protein LOC108092567 n=1 Tax=Drosophila ficusphila TaxID=30025 RepID=UPI0007E5C9DA|nr:uncharacterized protein LOC108092567 [Drosophila ficusphila]
MSFCCEAQKQRSCDCPPGLTVEKDCRAPFFDMLGPHPDEVIMTILDRILYLSGATKIIPMLELSGLSGLGSAPKSECGPPPTNSGPCLCSSACSSARPSSSAWSTCCSHTPSSCCTKPPSSSCSRKVPLVPCNQKSCNQKSCCLKLSSRLGAAACCPRQRTPRVDFDHPAEIIPIRKRAGMSPVKERFDRSISTCSVACEQLKTKLKTQESPAEKDQKWLWTRLVHGKDGCMVYEVYKDSDGNNSPSRIGSESPIILFLVMPNGCIMPFESICSP